MLDRVVPVAIALLSGVRVGAIAAGHKHSLLVSTSGLLYSCGSGFPAMHGIDSATFQLVLSPRPVAVLQGVRVLAVSAGFCHSLVLGDAGEVYSFGTDVYGALGHGEGQLAATPRVVQMPVDVKVRSIATGHSASLAVTTTGALYGWGREMWTDRIVTVNGTSTDVIFSDIIPQQHTPKMFDGLTLMPA